MSLSHASFASFSILAVLTLASPSRAEVLTVGPPGSGAQFDQIQAAVDAAHADDVLLVQPGTYQLVVVDKPLRILGVAPGVLIDAGVDRAAVTVRGIPGGQELVLAGVEASSGSFFTIPTVIQLENAPGTVVLQDVTVTNDLFESRAIALRSTDCARVLVLDCRFLDVGRTEIQTAGVVVERSTLWMASTTIRGAQDPYFTYSGARGIEATDARLHVWRSEISGGHSDGKGGVGSGNGGAAILARRTTLELFGGPVGALRGGDGGAPIFGEGLGAPGLELLDASRALVQRALPVTGGLDAFTPTQAPPVRADASSSFVLEPETFPTLQAGAPRVTLGASFSMRLEGTPGGYQVLFLALRTGPTTILRGVDGFGLLPAGNLFQLANPVLPPSGHITVDVPVPSTPSLLGATLFLQSAERIPNCLGLCGTNHRFALGNPVLVTISG